jgi:hypothetical protein
MKELVEQGDVPVDKELYDRSGPILRDLAQSIGLSEVPRDNCHPFSRPCS